MAPAFSSPTSSRPPPSDLQGSRHRGRFPAALGKAKEKLDKIIGDYDGLAVRSATKVTAEDDRAAKKLKVVGRAGIGVDNVDIKAATAKGIIVMNTPFGNSITTAEHAISLMMALARQIPEADASTQGRQMGKEQVHGGRALRQDAGRDRLRQHRLHRRRPRHRAQDEGDRLRSVPVAERAVELGVEKVELDDLLRRADFITLHTPLTDKTRNIIDAGALEKTKKGVRIVNCARGGLVDERALAEALKSARSAARLRRVRGGAAPRTARCSACPT